MNWAKWILTGMGWVIGGPIGAVIGYFVGKSVTKTNPQLGGSDGMGDMRHQGRYTNTGTPQDLTVALIVLVAAVMKSDGQVRQSELNYVKRFLIKNYEEEKANDLLHMLRDVIKQDFDLRKVCRQIMVNTDYDTRYHMLDFLFGLAEADWSFDMAEERTLRLIATYLGINSQDFTGIYARHVGNKGGGGNSGASASSKGYAEDPYKVLGIEGSATDEEVKRAYRRLALKYHPDKVEGMGEEVKRNAEAQFRKISEAYETIKRARNIK